MNDIPKDSIAIIGLAFRFPGAQTAEQFWQNLKSGVESITPISDDALIGAGIAPGLLQDPRYVKAAGALDDIERFDAALFNMSPSEAELIDPQQRLFLECAWESLENAGYCGDRGQWRIGVFGGVGVNRYFLDNYDRRLFQAGSALKAVTGNDKDYLTTRVSYKLGLTGPSVCVQTACSTSLVAVHLACRSLLDYQTDIALAGAISLRLPQQSGYVFEEGGILSPDGHCRAFDADAGGTVFSSGVGIVVLKRLDEAIEDGDTIAAVIRGSAINNDGAVKVGFTAPSIEAQAEVIAEALGVADVDARSISYVEAHGTGTVLGDPIEIAALTKAYRGWTTERQFCPIGSVKTNIGHLDTAAGIAGLIKTVLALQHQQLPPSLHFRQPNPRIDFAGSPFYVNQTLTQWKSHGSPRRAGISSFGLGGTNSHVIVEEAPITTRASRSRRSFHIVPLSAKTEEALQAATASLENYLSDNPQADLGDIAFTYQVGRKTFSHRRVMIANDPRDAVRAITDGKGQSLFASVEESVSRPVAFLFPGQGSQFVNMGRELYETESLYKKIIDTAAEVLSPYLGSDLREILYPKAGTPGQDLSHTSILQPALFATEYALAKLWQKWGIPVQAMIGHSLGEYVAACIAGVMSFEEGLTLVAQRGQLIGNLPTGAMLAVPVNKADIQARLGKELSVAAVNAEDRLTISGTVEAISELEQALRADGISSQRLQTSHAFHSSMMEPILDEFREVVGKLTLRPPSIPFVSNVTGDWITAQEATAADYWVRHLRSTVRFYDGLRKLTGDTEIALLEAGPGRTLSSLAKYSLKTTDRVKFFTSMPARNEPGEQEAHSHRTLGQLWLAGVPVAWDSFQKEQGRKRLPLPGYAFQRQKYWLTGNHQPRETGAIQPDAARADTPQLYIPAWQRTPRRLPTPESSVEPIQLIIYDQREAVLAIARGLQQNARRTIMVCAGQTFRRLDDSTYTINGERAQDYQQLFASLVADNCLPSRIIHLLNCGSDFGRQPPDSRLFSFYSPLYLAQAVGKHLQGSAVDLAIISSNAQAVNGRERLEPEKALIAGLCTVMPQEYPNVTCRWIDVDFVDTDPISLDTTQSRLIEELQSDSIDATVAYRGGERFIKNFAEVKLPPQTTDRMGLREHGVYLITGGFGGIGKSVAAYLASQVKAKLILTGRTALPERALWESLIRQLPESDEVVARIKVAQELEQAGAEVLALTADVTDEAQIGAAIELAEQRFGKLHGIIHTAGIASDNLIQTTNRSSAEAVLAAKIEGARVLAKGFPNYRLDFFVLCSSLASLLGGAGRMEYVAANAFLDAFAHHLETGGIQPCVSINWDSWRQTGIAAQAAVPTALGRMLNLSSLGATADGLNPQIAAALLFQLAAGSFAQVVVCQGDLHKRLQDEAQHKLSAFAIANECASTDHRAHPRPDLFTPYVAPATPAEQIVAEVWQEVLGLERVGIDDSIFELGGDSVSAIRVSQKLSEKLGISVPPVRLFTESTVRALAATLAPEASPSANIAERQSRGQRRRAKRLSS
ncbi:MAG: SDR family NAD(P)-dependent oxidoreductase [Acidobacteria bacterium]|nr:SDR family NAD(P)-dependent oxidoreductase [Acidobacteriota bacterium]